MNTYQQAPAAFPQPHKITYLGRLMSLNGTPRHSWECDGVQFYSWELLFIKQANLPEGPVHVSIDMEADAEIYLKVKVKDLELMKEAILPLARALHLAG